MIAKELLRPGLAGAGQPILDVGDLSARAKVRARRVLRRLRAADPHPLAVDAEHPFPFISNLGLNLAALVMEPGGKRRFVRIKVPANRPRWVPLPGGGLWCRSSR